MTDQQPAPLQPPTVSAAPLTLTAPAPPKPVAETAAPRMAPAVEAAALPGLDAKVDGYVQSLMAAEPRSPEFAAKATDVTVASGIFNVMAGTDVDDWRAYTLDTIQDLASLSRTGLGFNMLTSYSDPERMQDRLYYGDPGFYFDWCKRNLSRHVALLHDYGLWEFTILVRFDA